MTDLTDTDRERLLMVLERSRQLGFLGPGPVEAHIRHAMEYVPFLDDAKRVLDLGSGGGIPGLVIALALPEARLSLLDAGSRRCAFLQEAIEDLRVADRVTVLGGRAEELGRATTLRQQFDAVVARSFGPPAVLAECSVGFLKVGGLIVVSEPPDEEQNRWPRAGLTELGLVPETRTSGPGGTIQSLRLTEPCSDKFPRRVGVPSKRPIF